MRATKTIIASFFLVTLVFLSLNNCRAQSERFEKIRQISHDNWERMINLIGIEVPDSLPDPAVDPKRPDSTFQKESSGNWYDSLGNTYVRSPWGEWTNYDESKANPYPNLPDPLELNSGQKVSTPEAWWERRRPEIVSAFTEEIYGKMPENTPDVDWQVLSVSDTTIGEIPARKKQIIGEVDNSSYPEVSVNIQLELIIPADIETPVPVIIHFDFNFPPGFSIPGSDNSDQKSWQEQTLQKGWAYANYIPASVQPDHAAGLSEGIIGLINKGELGQPSGWGALRAWAWGASRVLDYFQTDKNVDSEAVGVEGVSRYGKAALVTMAYDQRFAIALVGSSGKGGATLYRRNFGETIGILSSSGEYHWFAGKFIRYAGSLNASDLPVDTHELIAMCAPRPVFISVGSPEVEGRWMDNKGQFMALAAASSVYRLLGKEGIGMEKMPPMGKALVEGNLAFRQHFGGHTDVPNWPYFLEFAEKYFK